MRWALILLLFSLAVPVNAGNRATHFSGFDLGIGQPFPSIFGGLIGFNIGDDARISGGLGFASPWTVYQIDGKIFLSPDDWAMYVGGGLDYFNGRSGDFIFWDLQFDRGIVPYIQTGVDFQSEPGVHLNINLGVAIPNGQIVIIPGLALGWYF